MSQFGERPFIQFFKNETIYDNIGTAINFKNLNNAGVTIVENCKFENNVGTYGGAINMEEAGSLIGYKNHFSLDKANLVVPDEILDLINLKQEHEIKLLG